MESTREIFPRGGWKNQQIFGCWGDSSHPLFSRENPNCIGVSWCMAFNIHFSVPAILELCVYLCFPNSILFWWMSFILFNFSATLFWLFMRHILKIIWKFQHWHLGISIDAPKFNFSLTKSFWKNNTYDQYNSCITLLQLLISLWYFFSSIWGIHWHSRKKVVWIFGATIH